MTVASGCLVNKLKLRVNMDANFVVNIKYTIIDFKTSMKTTGGFEIFLSSTQLERLQDPLLFADAKCAAGAE